MIANSVEPIEILLIEDNPGDVALTRKALERSKISNNLNVARDGDEALAYLRQSAGYEDTTRPQLILLDLNLPGIDGRDVLDQIKADPSLRSVPVVVMTSSAAEEDVLRSYESHANCYITKPVTMESFQTVVAAIDDFWFSVVRLPRT